jgi:hypothetical protein
VKPQASVTVDGKSYGKVTKVSLAPGPHVIVLDHPDFQPLQRVLTISPGTTTTLTVDLKDESLPRAH